MGPGHIKGALLEYLTRKLLQNCGFRSVRPDGHYIYQSGNFGLFMINGKGSAHDADVLMEPPIQMPFSYPSRILFECKAYGTNTGLSVVRNALGLRYDINEFEIITDESIERRKNNRRSSYAISEMKRFNYQVGVSSVGNFSASAFEFAANNKISLLSLRWFLPEDICNLFHGIDANYIRSIGQPMVKSLYQFLKDKGREELGEYGYVPGFLDQDQIVGKIIRAFEGVIGRCFIGLIETGDLIFLFSESQHDDFWLLDQNRFEGIRARIHYYQDEPNQWILALRDGLAADRPAEFRFYVPDRIMSIWRQYHLGTRIAIDIKEQYFSRIFIFSGQRPTGSGLPFVLVNIDTNWLDEIGVSL